MKISKLLPKLTAPVQRLRTVTSHKQANGGVALSYCDLATRECFEDAPFPFAGDDAE
jgi:prenylated cyclic peptide (anacyclamide/piricyclamide family)